MKITELHPLIADELATLPQDELKSFIRAIRSPMLQESDWTQLPDSPLTDTQRAEWAVYRQALRDITKTYGDDLLEAEFPVRPDQTV